MTASKNPTSVLTVRISAEHKERLERLASVTARTKSWLAAHAIESYLELQEWQIEEIRAGAREADAGDFATDEEVAAVIRTWTR